jgi:serine/threonine protein kinase
MLSGLNISKCNLLKAPELFRQFAKFSSKADVFASGIVFLELCSLHPPNFLYRDLWPMVLDLQMPKVLTLSLTSTLQEDPEKRKTFNELFVMLNGVEGREIAEQDNEEFAEDFFDVSGRIQDFIASSSSRNYSHSASQSMFSR